MPLSIVPKFQYTVVKNMNNRYQPGFAIWPRPECPTEVRPTENPDFFGPRGPRKKSIGIRA